MGTYENMYAEIGAKMDADHAAVMAALADQPDPEPTPEPPDPEPGGLACRSGVYTGANKEDGVAETSFGNWRERPVEKVLAFTPDDTWDYTWWMSVYGDQYPYRD